MRTRQRQQGNIRMLGMKVMRIEGAQLPPREAKAQIPGAKKRPLWHLKPANAVASLSIAPSPHLQKMLAVERIRMTMKWECQCRLPRGPMRTRQRQQDNIRILWMKVMRIDGAQLPPREAKAQIPGAKHVVARLPPQTQMPRQKQVAWTKSRTCKGSFRRRKVIPRTTFEREPVRLRFSDKNRLLRRTATTQTSQASKTIPKPKGSVGAAGFSLIAEMKLNKQNEEDKALYNDILVRCEILLNHRKFTDDVGICACTGNRYRYRPRPHV